jgi:thiamine transport system permease protein
VDRDRAAVAGKGLSRRARWALLAVPLAFIALFFAYPLVAILERSLVEGGRLRVPWDALGSASTLRILWFTTWQALASTALTLAAGLPLAWVVGRFSFPGRRLVRALVLVPFVLPTIVVATAFLALLPSGSERGVCAILAAHVFFNVAVAVRVVGGYWSGLAPSAW